MTATRPRLPRQWQRLPPQSIRLRLTVLYGGLFLASGAALLAITYVLVRNRIPVVASASGVVSGLGVRRPAVPASSAPAAPP